MTRTVHRPRRRGRISRPAIVEQRGQRWEDLLAVAGRLFAEDGVAQVSVERILLAAGLSRGTFYSFCRSKTDLLVALLEPVFREGVPVLQSLAAGPATAVVPGIVDLYEDLWARRRHALMLIPAIDRAAFARLRAAHDEYTTAMRSALARAEAGGLLRNGSARDTFRVLARTAVPLRRIYQDHPDGPRLYRESLLALLLG